MNKLSTGERVKVVRCLVDGCSMRATSRITGVARNTIDKLLVELGAACSKFQDTTLRNLFCQRIQVDEIWAFCYCKQKQVTSDIAEARIMGTFGPGQQSTPILNWSLAGPLASAMPRPLRRSFRISHPRLADRAQVTSDGLAVYMNAIVKAFGEEVDYAKLIKIYGNDQEGEKRYSPAVCTGCEKHEMIGSPDPKHISTSFIERQNLTMRMGMRRFNRLTNAFSKKIENHAAAVSLHMMYHNFGRKHMTLGTSPAVVAGVAHHIWAVEEIVALVD